MSTGTFCVLIGVAWVLVGMILLKDETGVTTSFTSTQITIEGKSGWKQQYTYEELAAKQAAIKAGL